MPLKVATAHSQLHLENCAFCNEWHASGGACATLIAGGPLITHRHFTALSWPSTSDFAFLMLAGRVGAIVVL